MAYNPPPSRGMTTSGAMDHKMEKVVEVESSALLRLASSVQLLELEITTTYSHFSHILKPRPESLGRANGPEVAPASNQSGVRIQLEAASDMVDICSRSIGEMRERLDF